MATDRQIKTRISRAVKAFEAKDWDRFKTERDWLIENLDETQHQQYQQEIITRLDEIDPGDDAPSFFYRGNAKNHLGDYQGAIADYDEAIRLNPDDAGVFNNRGNAKQDLEDYQGAIKDFDEAIRLNPDDAFAFNNRGATKGKLGDHQGAVADFDEAIRLKDNFSEAFFNRGSIKNELGNHQGAIADHDEAIRLKPDYADAFNNRGMAKGDLGDHQGAIADFDEAIRLVPTDAEPFSNRGSAKGELGNHLGAIADHDEAIRLKPDFAEAFNNRGATKGKLGDYQGAITDYNEAIRLKPDFAEAFNNRGIAKGDLGDHQGAIADFDEAIRLKPDFAEAIHNRALALVLIEAKQRAEKTRKEMTAAYDKSLADLQKEQRKVESSTEINKEYDRHIKESRTRLEDLRGESKKEMKKLVNKIWLFWLILFLLISISQIVLQFLGHETGPSYSLLLTVLATSFTTGFLLSPRLLLLNRLHRDMRVERAMIEDLERKRKLLKLRLLERSMIEQNTAIVMEHFANRGTPEVLMDAYDPKSRHRPESEKTAERGQPALDRLTEAIKQLASKKLDNSG